MRRLILLERAPDVWEAEEGDQVVSLAPQASYWLDKNKRQYRIPADFGIEEKLKEREDSYWQEQLAWFNQVDTLLQERLPELKAGNISPAILYGYHLKALLDHHFIRGIEIGTLLEGEFDQVLLWPSDPPAALPQRFLDFCLEHRGVYSRLLSHWCAERGILYQEISPPVPPTLTRLRAAFPTQWKARLKEWRWRVRGILPATNSAQRRLMLLFLETGDYLGDILKEAIKKEHRCLISDGKDHLLDLSKQGRSLKLLESPDPFEGDGTARWAQVAEDLFGFSSPVWNWPDSWFGHPMAPFLCDCLKQWVQQDLAQLIRSSNRLKRIYLRERVDFVLTPFLITPLDFAAVAACDGSVPAQSVLVADGDGPDEAKVWDLTELSRTQHYIVPHSEFAQYFRTRQAPRPAAQIHVGSDRWQRYTRLAGRRPLRRWGGEASRPVVVYVVSRRERDIRYLNKTEYPETWYYRLQCALLETFADLPGYTFVVKLFPTPDPGPGAVAAKVRDLQRNHIFVSRAPFRRWLRRADRVILDAPSTPLYETALAGVPFHLLVHRKAAIRPTGLSSFTSCLTLFENPQEAAFAVKRYLSSPPVGAPSISAEGLPLLTTLETLG